ncbi:hypothetical protein H3H36_12935 [Duganella sp. FT3S]|uniref:Uncharacterized protein n=1 Tax=Rugamonas fusca TaxID=2758568 RepID=A0A7W2I7B1_9BURK|nr:hypothetical protein [Rugamonas fusca]MBA5606259.1 hypothetical protein [Rugamonas fusca]
MEKILTTYVIAALPLLLGARLATAADEFKPPASVLSAPVSSLVSGPGIQFQASNDGSSVSAKVAKQYSFVPKDSSDVQAATFTSLSFTMDAPIDKSEKRHDLFSLDGWGNATSIGVSYSKFLTGWTQTKAQPEDRKKLCAELEGAAKAKEGKLPDGFECSAQNFQKYLPERSIEGQRDVGGPNPGGWLFGGALKYATQDSTYYDPGTLAKSKERNEPWSVGVFVGWNPPPMSAAFLIFRVDRKSSYKDADVTVRCPAATSGVTVQCVSGSFGAPTMTQATSLGLEARSLIGTKYAVSLAVSRDTSKKVTTIELPVYWIGDGNGGLNGGVKAGWNSDDKKAVLGLFVGAPFTAWP